MRKTVRRGGEEFYSPDDGDHEGFLALVRKWVEEDLVPVPDRVVVRFCQHWDISGKSRDGSPITVGLRSKEQWLAELRRFGEREGA